MAKINLTGRLCVVQNQGGGWYIELSNGMVSPIFADEGRAIAWFGWLRGGCKGSYE